MKEIFNPTLSAHLSLDAKQRVRAIRHSKEHWVSNQTIPLAAAINYFQQMRTTFNITDAKLKDMQQKVSYLYPYKKEEVYRLSEEKRSFASHTIGFCQTYNNVPVWQAGLKVTMKTGPNRIVRSVNNSQDNINAKLPSQKVIDGYRKLFDGISQAPVHGDVEDKQYKSLLSTSAGVIRESLGAESGKKEERARIDDDARMIRGRFFIYRYDPDARLPQQHPVPDPPDIKSKGKVTEGGHEPVLPLPPVDKRIKEDRYYMVAEVTFTYSTPEYHKLNWRMLIELETGSVLYLRALVGAVNGYVFTLDPISATGNTGLTSDQNNATLNPHRDDITLNNLDTPVDGEQLLRGTYANLTDVHTPDIIPPTEPSGDDFYFDVRTDDFAAVSAYYHVNKVFEVFESLGFIISNYFSNTNFPIQVDHRGFGGAINAHCVGDGMGGIAHSCYGIMDTTDTVNPLGRACDPRVHWHELCGHGILYESVDGPNMGFSHSAGDGLSGIFHDPESLAPGDVRFEYVPWHPSLRRYFNRNVADGWAWGGSHDNSGYGSEEILATSLFRIYQSIGGDSPNLNRRRFASRMMLYLIFQTIGNLTPATNPNYAREFVDELIAADQLNWTSEGVYGGAYNKVIRWSFEKQGEYQNPLIERTDPAFGSITTPGVPPSEDVYIDDGRQGEYGYQQVHWHTATIWNRLLADGVDAHQPPVLGETNYAYVKIKNRGPQTAHNVIVKGFHSKPMAGILWPNDLQAFTTPEIAVGTLLGNNGEEKIVGPFEWTPIINAYGHDCMLMIVSSDEDPSNIDNFTPGEVIPAWRLVTNDNNVGQRNVQPVPGGGGSEGLVAGLDRFGFWVGNPDMKKATMKLKVKLPDILAKKGWKLSFAGIQDNQFQLKPGKQKEVVIDIKPGQDFTKEEIEAVRDRDIQIYAFSDGSLIGGMTYQVDPAIIKPYDVSKPDCVYKARDLLDCLNIRDQKVSKVCVQKVTVEIKIDNDCCCD